MQSFRSIYLLPGGPANYLETLTRILHTCSESEFSTRAEVIDWLVKQYPLTRNTATNCLQMVRRFGLLNVVGKQGEIEITESGIFFLGLNREDRQSQIAEILLRYGVAFPTILKIFANAKDIVEIDEISASIIKQFGWDTDWSLEARIHWLVAVDCLERIDSGSYRITTKGQDIASRFQAVDEIPLPRKVSTYERRAHLLAKELEDASRDSRAYQRLEHATAEAFEYLGFQVKLLGGSGTTDILVSAEIGPKSYRAIVDAKARQDGRLDSIEAFTLKEHRNSLSADYAVVVAQQFGGVKIHRQALEGKVLLLSTSMLGKLLLSHAVTPLNLLDYQAVFEYADELTELPEQLTESMRQKQQCAHVISDLVELFDQTYQRGWRETLLTESLTPMLVNVLDDRRYRSDEVRAAVSLLAHPSMSALISQLDNGVFLAVSRPVLAHMLHVLADTIERGA